jgi:nitroreductase
VRVSQALASRITCRAFLDDEVQEATVRAILTGASQAPSGGNLQPWRVWALAGGDLARIEAQVKAKIDAGQILDGAPDYSVYPPDLKEPYATRRFRNGEAVYAALGIGRDDYAARAIQVRRNFEFFGAPVGLFFAIDRSMQQGQWADLGMFMQSVMLLAREYGLHTAALESWSLWHRTVRDFLGMPDELMLFCGMALGRLDPSRPVNQARVGRAPLDEIAVLRGFGA